MSLRPERQSTLVYITGEPGAGKSTLMAELTAGCRRVAVKQGMVRWDLLYGTNGSLEPVAVELGVRRGMFSGTDGLGMAVAPQARQWISEPIDNLVLAEGDRLSSMTFLDAAAGSGHQVILVVCEPPAQVAEARRIQRGTTQNRSWVMGRRTKTHRFADAATRAGYRVVRLDTRDLVAVVAARLRGEVEELECLP